MVNIPEEFEYLKQFPKGNLQPDSEIKANRNYDFLLLFVQTEATVSECALKLKDNLADDAVL
jgi:hypothetical protein